MRQTPVGYADLGATGMTAAESFNILFTAVPSSATLRHIWRVVYGPDYPEEADPFSFVTVTDLHRIAGELGVGWGQTVLDLACGPRRPWALDRCPFES
ncbi:MAG TPA: hypothetical protein VF990_09030 [Candidatus Dormibacteraeota bacterium]